MYLSYGCNVSHFCSNEFSLNPWRPTKCTVFVYFQSFLSDKSIFSDEHFHQYSHSVCVKIGTREKSTGATLYHLRLIWHSYVILQWVKCRSLVSGDRRDEKSVLNGILKSYLFSNLCYSHNASCTLPLVSTLIISSNYLPENTWIAFGYYSHCNGFWIETKVSKL